MPKKKQVPTFLETRANFVRRMRKLYDRKDWKKYDLEDKDDSTSGC